MTTYLYAVQMMIPDYPYAPIKIGISGEPEKRVREYTRSPFPTVWLGQWPGASADELAAHAQFSQFRLCGEWFYPSREVREFVELNIGRSITATLAHAKRSKRDIRFAERLTSLFPVVKPSAGAVLPDPFPFQTGGIGVS